jgi:hypothetical protein
MVGCLGQSRGAQDSDVAARAVTAVTLAALAVIHVVDLPGTLGPTPLVGIGYRGIVAVATLTGAVIVVRSHWLAWARLLAAHRPRRPSALRVLPGWTENPANQDRPLRPVQ